MFMPFGKYKGYDLRDIPLDYLDWLLNKDLYGRLHEEVERERDERHARQERERQQRERQERQARGEYAWEDGGAPSSRCSQTRPCPNAALVSEVLTAGRKVLARKYHPDPGRTQQGFLQLTAVMDWLARLVTQHGGLQ